MQTDTLYLPPATRHFEDFGFMQAYLSFKPNFSEERQCFGSLVTIDDSMLQPGAKGFGLHPHKDVEVITFMISGEVKHIDSNNASLNGTLKSKGIQIKTAGSGIVHNEDVQSKKFHTKMAKAKERIAQLKLQEKASRNFLNLSLEELINVNLQ